MSALHIARGLSIPLDAVTETFAFLAKRGAGKTYTAKVFVEELLKNDLQTVVLDPMGAWWGLRSSADGKGPGFPVAIFGGEHGDLPLEPTGGELIADLIVDEGLSAIIDVSLFSKAKRKEFVVAFAERLYQRNRAALHLVLEEADLFAPQRPQRGEERMLGAVPHGWRQSVLIPVPRCRSHSSPATNRTPATSTTCSGPASEKVCGTTRNQSASN